MHNILAASAPNAQRTTAVRNSYKCPSKKPQEGTASAWRHTDVRDLECVCTCEYKQHCMKPLPPPTCWASSCSPGSFSHVKLRACVVKTYPHPERGLAFVPSSWEVTSRPPGMSCLTTVSCLPRVSGHWTVEQCELLWATQYQPDLQEDWTVKVSPGGQQLIEPQETLQTPAAWVSFPGGEYSKCIVTCTASLG